MRIRNEHGKHRENSLSISLEHDLSTERNLCFAAGAASAPLCKGRNSERLLWRMKRGISTAAVRERENSEAEA